MQNKEHEDQLFQNCTLCTFALHLEGFLLSLLKSYFISLYKVSTFVNSAGVLSQNSSICAVPCCLSLLTSTSLNLPLLNFARDSLPSDNTALLSILLPCMTSVQLLITSLCYLGQATNHHLSLLAKRDHFIVNTDST